MHTKAQIPALGSLRMPPDFPYADVYLQGPPQHERYDEFSLRHPRMDPARRAKIFAPFDALRGFSFAILTKQAQYVDRPELSAQQAGELSRRLAVLHGLTRNSRAARENSVLVTARWYVPCADPEHEAYGRRGSIRSVTDLCRGVDPEPGRCITVGNERIALEDLLSLESPVFQKPPAP